MPEPYAWDCQNPRCLNRNVWKFLHCHACGLPRQSGEPLYYAAPRMTPPPAIAGPFEALDRFYREHPGWFWAISLLMGLAGLTAWPILVVTILIWIGMGIWSIHGRQGPR